jgi:hypothetical protein
VVYPILSHCCTEYGRGRGVVLSGHLITVAERGSGQQGRRCTVAACSYILQALMVAATLARRVRVENTLALMTTTALSGAWVLRTRHASCTAGPATPFFILDSHDP